MHSEWKRSGHQLQVLFDAWVFTMSGRVQRKKASGRLHAHMLQASVLPNVQLLNFLSGMANLRQNMLLLACAAVRPLSISLQ